VNSSLNNGTPFAGITLAGSTGIISETDD